MEILRRNEKRELLQKITVAVGKCLERWNSDKGWTDIEISRQTGVPTNRLAEYKGFARHGRAVSEKHLLALIEKGFVTVEQLRQEAAKEGGLSEREESFLDGIAAVESESLRAKILRARRAGIDVEKLLEDAMKRE
ncbi:hypothetical protein [Desulfuromonas thiophila]|uniref:Uncharacterized protein n=1 Tax=Desulfuromonas thiophila TaxID=57664 RepID=A0A1G7B407_9BACT|nr:hypothetical protein [Desulfuromonas thiophila]SDE21640.1 hypothetical protein SAMN05661003_10549 [Desulfuromonas thiophila]